MNPPSQANNSAFSSGAAYVFDGLPTSSEDDDDDEDDEDED